MFCVNPATHHSPKVGGFLFAIFVTKINKQNMIKIDTLYNTYLDLLSKNNSEHIGYEEFNRYVNMSSLELFDDLVGSKNNPQIVYGKNRITDRRLDGFRESESLQVPTNKTVPLPQDLKFIRNILDIDKNYSGIEPIDEDRVGRIYDDSLANPNEDDKYYVEMKGAVRILNDDINNIQINYLKKPTEAKYATRTIEIRGRERQVFDELNSVDLVEWDSSEMTEILTRLLAKSGLSMRDGFVTQVANNNKAQE